EPAADGGEQDGRETEQKRRTLQRRHKARACQVRTHHNPDNHHIADRAHGWFRDSGDEDTEITRHRGRDRDAGRQDREPIQHASHEARAWTEALADIGEKTARPGADHREPGQHTAQKRRAARRRHPGEDRDRSDRAETGGQHIDTRADHRVGHDDGGEERAQLLAFGLAHCALLRGYDLFAARLRAKVNCFFASSLFPDHMSASPHFWWRRCQFGAYLLASANFASARSERFLAISASPHISSGSAKCGLFWCACSNLAMAPSRSPFSISICPHSRWA